MASLKASLPKQLYTERLILDLWNDSNDHVTIHLAVLNNPVAYSRAGDDGIKTREDLLKLIRNTYFKDADLCPGKSSDTNIIYIARLSDSVEKATPVGVVSIAQRSKGVPPDIGWSVLPEFMGHGYATEAARKLLSFATADLGMTEIVACPRKDNLQSIRVAEKIGLVQGPEVWKKGQSLPDIAFVLPGMDIGSFEFVYEGEAETSCGHGNE